MVRKAAKDEVFIMGGIDDQMKRKLIIALVTVLIIASFGALLNKISFDPDFSLVDALTGATKDDESEKAEGAAGRWYSRSPKAGMTASKWLSRSATTCS